MGELTRLERSTPFRVGVAMAYLGLNTSLNMLNRWALGQYKFRFPLLLTASHMIFGSIVLMQTFLAENGIVTDPLHIALWGIPTAIAAFVIHAARLLRLDRQLPALIAREGDKAAP